MTSTDHRIDHMTRHDLVCPPTPPEPRTANEAAAIAFPEVAKHFTAFLERKELDINQFTSIQIVTLEHEFWAHAVGPIGSPERPIVFASSEKQFRQYNPDTGLFEPITAAKVTGRIIDCLDLCAAFFPPRVQAVSFINLKTRKRLNAVVERAQESLAVDDSYWQDHKPVHIAPKNGLLLLDGQVFHPSDPGIPIREALPVRYDPKAESELFLRAFLRFIIDPADIDLLQRYLSQILEGKNHAQKILVLTGDAGWGKSSLMKILGSLIGWNRMGIIREQLFKDEYELAHYAGKHFLFHPDMPTAYLDRPEASIFKQLCGSDPLWANVKCDPGRVVIHGEFPIVLSCNGKPKIHIDEDSDAWLRRLVVVSLRAPQDRQHFGKLADLIIKTEGPGVLNWLLQGRQKLFKDKFQLKMTDEQKARAANLLLASQSPATFIQSCLEERDGAELTAAGLYSSYVAWCQANYVRPLGSQAFTQIAKEDIELRLGLRYRHDLGGNEGASRGWKGVGLLQNPKVRNLENASAGSEAAVQASTIAQA